MKPAETSIGYGADGEKELTKAYGPLLHEVDHSGEYDTDSVVLHKKGQRYALLRASSCSCYTAVYDGWTYLKDDLLKWASKNTDKYGSEEEMASWIRENVK
jgi:hypothetical protein